MSQKDFQIGIKKIKDTEFFIDEQVDIKDISQVSIGFELKININSDEKTIEMVFAVIYTNNIDNKIIFKIRTSNVFLIPELLTYKKKEEVLFDLPDNMLITLLGLSISHTRALLAKNSNGTKFSDLNLPIVNPTDIYYKLFPKK
ncbi:MAG: hypothetical protein A2X08_15975 [Bacteroidetes bacterium GWA2_32_17]|nr:MAG: hypothetical protein A2X08_15975 [Bacteroidetes bacterium GWA2_32_17]